MQLSRSWVRSWSKSPQFQFRSERIHRQTLHSISAELPWICREDLKLSDTDHINWILYLRQWQVMHACHIQQAHPCARIWVHRRKAQPGLRHSNAVQCSDALAALPHTANRDSNATSHKVYFPPPFPSPPPPRQPQTQCLNTTPIRSVRITTPHRSEPLLDVCSQHGVGVTKLWVNNPTAQREGTFLLRRRLGHPTGAEQPRLIMLTKHSLRCPLSPL